MNKKFKLNKWLRTLHRDLGYLFIGLCVIYAVSGILIALKSNEQNPSYKEIKYNENLDTDLSIEDVKGTWEEINSNLPALTRIIPKGEIYYVYVKGGMGEYNPVNGKLSVTCYKEVLLLKIMNDIHYNAGKRYSFIAIIFGVMLIFFAISGAMLVKGKNGFRKRGVWLMLIGFAIPVAWYFIA